MITINWHPSAKELRHWGLITAAVLAMMGSLFYFIDWGLFRAGHGMAVYLWAFAACALLTAGTGTRIGLPAYWLWMGMAWTIGTIMGTVALALVYYLAVTPLAVIARIAGRDRLQMRPVKGASMWRPLSGTAHDPERTF